MTETVVKDERQVAVVEDHDFSDAKLTQVPIEREGHHFSQETVGNEPVLVRDDSLAEWAEHAQPAFFKVELFPALINRKEWCFVKRTTVRPGVDQEPDPEAETDSEIINFTAGVTELLINGRVEKLGLKFRKLEKVQKLHYHSGESDCNLLVLGRLDAETGRISGEPVAKLHTANGLLEAFLALDQNNGEAAALMQHTKPGAGPQDSPDQSLFSLSFLVSTARPEDLTTDQVHLFADAFKLYRP